MRPVLAALRAVGWLVLGILALAGVALSLGVILASSGAGRPLVARFLISYVDAEVAGRLELGGIDVLPSGGIGLRDFRVFDPDGHLVLAVDRLQIFADVKHLRNRSIGLQIELDGPAVLLEEEEGGVSLARAFAPSHPSPPRPPREVRPGAEAGPGWTARVARLTIRDGAVWWRDRSGATRLEASALDVDGRALIGPHRTLVDVSLRGALDLPFSGPLSLEVRGGIDGHVARASVLRARVGDTVLDGLGQVDLATGAGRAALVKGTVDRAEVRTVVPAAGQGADLALAAYAESDGRVATAAVSFEPRAGASGRGDVAAAARVSGARAVGFDADLAHLDPARIHGAAPAGDVTLRAHGAVAGTSLEALRGRVALTLARSRLRGGSVGSGEVDASVDAGTWTVRRLALVAPGVTVDGSGTWRPRGAVAGRVTADGKDLRAAIRNVEALLDQKLTPLEGRARVDARLGGTADAPALDATVDAPWLATDGVRLAGAHAEAHLAGPVRALTGTVDATAERLRAGADDVARAVFLRASLSGGEAHLAASASIPRLGREPVTMQARARREGPRGEALLFQELTIGYPVTRWTLVRPATLELAGPRVDALELAAGPQRITIEGGFGARGALDARARLSSVRLEGLPAGILPVGLDLSGAVTADVRATGTTRAPRVSGTVALQDGAWRSVAGLRASGELGWDGKARRATASLAVGRAEGGAADVALDLPIPLAGRPGEPVSVRLRAEALPVENLLIAAGAEVPASGLLSLDARLEGAVATPALHAEATLTDGAYEDLSLVGITLAADTPGERLEVSVRSTLGGHAAVNVHGGLPLDLAELLIRPAPLLAGLRTAAFTADVTIPGLLLEDVSGRLGIPERLAGLLSGAARVEGTLAAPRGALSVDVAGGGYERWTGVDAHLEARADAARVAAAGRVALQGEELVRLQASLAAPLERLATRDGLRAAALALDAELPGAALARATGPDALVSGTLRGTITARGTLAAPRLAADVAGTALAVSGTPVGDARAHLDAEEGNARATVDLAAAPGGTLHAALAVAAPLSIDAPAETLRHATAELTFKADALQLGFLPAVAPTFFRAASGRLDADVSAKGPLQRLSPRGKARIQDGRLAISEYGDWTGIVVDATVTDDAVEIPTFVAHRGKGKVEAHAAIRGMSSGVGKVEGSLESTNLTISRSASDIATFTALVQADGTWKPDSLDVKLTVSRGLVRLPKRVPRRLEPLDRRPDIVVGPRRKERPVGTAVPAAAAHPFSLTARLVAPGRLQVQGDSPFVRMDLKADVTYEVSGSEDYMSGTVEVVRGDVEPISGRRFAIRRGKVTFTGGPPKAALLDVEAVYENPDATVTVNVAGPVADPEIRLSSQPPMDDSQIALLIATGRLELKPGTGGVQAFGQEQTGWAAAGALVATQLFQNVIQDRLPLDTVSLDASALRAGKYVTDRIYVGYMHRFDARTDQGQNADEVRVEYQITPRWAFEVRYGNAQSGSGSLIWSKDY